MSTLPDTGKRTEFETGAVRDASEGKGWPSNVPPIAIRKMAARFEAGGKKYGARNWMRGIPLSRYHDSLMRHLLAWAEGATDEDHMGAVLWNAACAAWTEEQIEGGFLPVSLDDLPYRVPREKACYSEMSPADTQVIDNALKASPQPWWAKIEQDLVATPIGDADAYLRSFNGVELPLDAGLLVIDFNTVGKVTAVRFEKARGVDRLNIPVRIRYAPGGGLSTLGYFRFNSATQQYMFLST